jgi:hypothetical protein
MPVALLWKLPFSFQEVSTGTVRRQETIHRPSRRRWIEGTSVVYRMDEIELSRDSRLSDSSSEASLRVVNKKSRFPPTLAALPDGTCKTYIPETQSDPHQLQATTSNEVSSGCLVLTGSFTAVKRAPEAAHLRILYRDHRPRSRCLVLIRIWQFDFSNGPAHGSRKRPVSAEQHANPTYRPSVQAF